MLYALPRLTFTCSFFYHATTFLEFKKVNVYYLILTVSFGCEMLSKALWLETWSFLSSKLKFTYNNGSASHCCTVTDLWAVDVSYPLTPWKYFSNEMQFTDHKQLFTNLVQVLWSVWIVTWLIQTIVVQIQVYIGQPSSVLASFFDHKTDVCIYFILAGSYVALTLLGKAPAHVQGSL